MREATDFQTNFVRMLQGEGDTIAPWLNDPANSAGLRVYQNNVITAWADTIVRSYPAIERLVGTEFMRGMAVAFVRAHPPRDPVMTLYGDVFPEFVEQFEPAKGLPYLADVARLDRAWTLAFFALPAKPVLPSDLGAMSETEMADLLLALHPSAQGVTSRWNVWELWSANRDGGEVKGLKLKSDPTAALVWWSPEGIAHRAISGATHRFLSELDGTTTLGEAMSHVPEAARPEVLAFYAEALAAGLFVAS